MIWKNFFEQRLGLVTRTKDDATPVEENNRSIYYYVLLTVLINFSKLAEMTPGRIILQ